MNGRAILINILVIVIILGGGGTALYYYNQAQNYVKTNNAQVTGQPISISSVSSGELQRWDGQVGKTFAAGDVVGSIKQPSGTVDITIPVSATIVQQSAVPHAFVIAGTPLARAYDFDQLWVAANVDETDINSIEVGQTVDVYIDAFPDTTLTGKVDQIGLATASTFSLLPTSNTTANYTKVTQVIPVTVTIDGYKGLNIVPGMSASVRIHI